jgi:methylenetetrahydrofolate dehydrogenase (NADP+)/methenyltetrahydrofolate cyclohydrolase
VSAPKAPAGPAGAAATPPPAAAARRAKPLDGKALAKRMEGELSTEVARLAKAHGRAPGLAVVLVGHDPASEVYVRRKQEACERTGIATFEHRLPPTVPEAELVALVRRLNADARVDGILVQLPLPAHVSKAAVLQSIAPAKDVDAFHAETMGHALIGDETLAPCTPQGVLLLLDEAGVRLPGAEVCIVNHSNLIGKPLAALLINRDATVTVCHKRTRDLAAHTRAADVLVTATGVPGLIRAEHVKPGAVVVDVGIHRGADGKLVGDVAFDEALPRASRITPVPGGVGPMTIAVLLQNTVRAFRRAVGAKPA